MCQGLMLKIYTSCSGYFLRSSVVGNKQRNYVALKRYKTAIISVVA